MKKLIGTIFGAVLAAMLLPVLAIGLICLYDADPVVRNTICLIGCAICVLGLIILTITRRKA